MGITTISYMGFALLIAVLYFCIPKRIRWILLLAGSIAYSVLEEMPLLLLYPVISIFVAWICTNKMASTSTGNRKKLLIIAIAANLGVLLVLKYLNFGVHTYNSIASRISSNAGLLQLFKFAAPLGVSFYTMSVMGYIFDVYYEISPAEKNYFKLLLFGMYFPLLISGPIIRYKDIKEELFEGHSLTYKNVTYGAQRILWGFFKVLVLSERLSIIVKEIFDNYNLYGWMYIWIGMWLFAFQLYSNFSGSMDIIIGISEILGIKLPENFRQPFFSQNIQEFWQRWHITLGGWLKDYILYPVLRTKFFSNLPNKWKEKLGKKKAKQYTTFLALFIVWFTIGLWHGGGWNYIWGVGLLQWVYIVISELCTPHWKNVKSKLKIKDDAKWFVLFKRIRTFVLISIGLLFFNASSLSWGFKMLIHGVKFSNTQPIDWIELGMEPIEWIIIGVSLLIVLMVSIINEKEDARDVLARRNIVVRWIILYALIFMVVIFGKYGPGYDAAQFIYQGF